MVLRRVEASSLIKAKSSDRDCHASSFLKDGGIALILQELILSYTTRDSSSIKEETASNMLCSICYALDAYSTALKRPVEMDSHLRDKGIRQIYAEGLNIVRSCVEDSKKLYQEIANTKLMIPMEAYNDTIDKALPEFFLTYDVEFAAQDTVSLMDYPLVFDDQSISGIFYINQYLQKLKLETRFCSCFRPESILQFLCGYGAKYDLDMIDTPLNLFEILFDQSVVSILCGNECGQLFVSGPQFQYLKEDLSVGNYHNFQKLVASAVNKMISDFDLESAELINYMHKYSKLYRGRLLNALEAGNLINLVIVDHEKQPDGTFIFEDGERMSDEDFIQLVNLILECEDLSGKVSLVISGVHSMGDYLDLLEADCLFSDEYLSVFEALDEIGIAVLGRHVFYEELRCGKLQLLPHRLIGFKENVEPEWQLNFIEYLLKLDDNKRIDIENLINRIHSVT